MPTHSIFVVVDQNKKISNKALTDIFVAPLGIEFVLTKLHNWIFKIFIHAQGQPLLEIIRELGVLQRHFAHFFVT